MIADLRTYILANSAISDEIDTRLYPTRAPQGSTKPYAVINTVGERSVDTHNDSGLLHEDTVEIVIYADTITKVYEIHDDMRSLLSNAKFAQGSTTFGKTRWIRFDTDYEESAEIFEGAFTLEITWS